MSTARAEKAISEMADIADVTAMAAITREFMANKVAKAFAAWQEGSSAPIMTPSSFPNGMENEGKKSQTRSIWQHRSK